MGQAIVWKIMQSETGRERPLTVCAVLIRSMLTLYRSITLNHGKREAERPRVKLECAEG